MAMEEMGFTAGWFEGLSWSGHRRGWRVGIRMLIRVVAGSGF